MEEKDALTQITLEILAVAISADQAAVKNQTEELRQLAERLAALSAELLAATR